MSSVGGSLRRAARWLWITAIGVQIGTALVHSEASGSRVVSSLHQPDSALGRERKCLRYRVTSGSLGFNYAITRDTESVSVFRVLWRWHFGCSAFVKNNLRLLVRVTIKKQKCGEYTYKE